MKINDYVQFIIYIALLIAITPPLGRYMAKVFEGEKTWAHRILGWLETATYKISGVNPQEEMNWKGYTVAFLILHVVALVLVMGFQMTQAWLPLNPQNLPNVSWHSAFNTAVSFITNTNWQGYTGEATMSYLTQMAALTVQNFLSAACGIAVAIALIRGISRRSTSQIGNFWVDMTRGVVYVLLPLCVIYALFLVGQGIVQTF
ncbi:MAG TPA: potassium-transporting ATPase subunit KdpA, partial [Bdellovibrio sp.]|nr:potassium-transporting ATPase subunit KdpA [Bdellovibrio sp.]